MKPYDLIVMGGGPAGSSAAITAARLGARALLLERGRFPRHKVCGEFVSGEALALLQNLLRADQQMLLSTAPRTSEARLFVEHRMVRFPILPAASISRYQLDLALWLTAVAEGVECRQDISVERVERAGDLFIASTSAEEFTALSAVDATGRWSKLRSERRLAAGLEGIKAAQASDSNKAHWLGVKAHFLEKDPAELTTDLYFFPGGYCGVQPLGDGEINVCAMVHADTATKLDDVIAQHDALRVRSARWQRFTDVVSTAPLIFHKPEPEYNGVLCVGDAAAFIDPFVGDGISMALRSGDLAGRVLGTVWRRHEAPDDAAKHYREQYRRRFVPALRTAGRLRKIMNGSALVRRMAVGAMRFSPVAQYVVGHTR